MNTNQIAIRDATDGDIAQMAALITELGYATTEEEMSERFHLICRNPDYSTLVAEKDGTLAALAGLAKGIYYEHNGNYLRIVAFVVAAHYRAQGIGKLLLKACEERAHDLRARVLLLNSGNRDERKAASSFYQKHGFVIKSSGFVKQLTD